MDFHLTTVGGYTSLLFLLPLFLSCTFLFNHYTRRRPAASQAPLPPGPTPWPVVGNLFSMGAKPHKSLANIAATHGPLFSLQLGRRTTIVISSPAVAREVLLSHDAAFAGRSVQDAATVLGHYKASVVLMSPCPRWRFLRRICATHVFANSKAFVKRPSEMVLRILKLLSRYVKDPIAAKKFVDILLPLLRSVAQNSDASMEALHILREVVPVLWCDTTTMILESLAPLLVVAKLDLRLSVCDLLVALAQKDTSLLPTAELVSQLNATSAIEVAELDFDVVIKAYDKISEKVFQGISVEHAEVILSHCIHHMTSEELLLRHSAYRSLLAFVDFSASVAGQEVAGSKVSEEKMEIDGSCWTEASTRRVIDKFLLKYMGDAFTGGLSIQKDITEKLFLPLFMSMLFDIKEKDEHLRRTCLDALASLSGKMEWKSYYALLMRCFQELARRPERQKVFLRLISSILDEFHFLDSAIDDANHPADSAADDDGMETELAVLTKCTSSVTKAQLQTCENSQRLNFVCFSNQWVCCQ